MFYYNIHILLINPLLMIYICYIKHEKRVGKQARYLTMSSACGTASLRCPGVAERGGNMTWDRTKQRPLNSEMVGGMDIAGCGQCQEHL